MMERPRRLRLDCVVLHVTPTEVQIEAHESRTCCLCDGGADTWDFCLGCRHYICTDCAAESDDRPIPPGPHALAAHTTALVVH